MLGAKDGRGLRGLSMRLAARPGATIAGAVAGAILVAGAGLAVSTTSGAKQSSTIQGCVKQNGDLRISSSCHHNETAIVGTRQARQGRPEPAAQQARQAWQGRRGRSEPRGLRAARRYRLTGWPRAERSRGCDRRNRRGHPTGATGPMGVAACGLARPGPAGATGPAGSRSDGSDRSERGDGPFGANRPGGSGHDRSNWPDGRHRSDGRDRPRRGDGGDGPDRACRAARA